MDKQRWVFGAILLILGMAGVFSILGMDVPLPPEAEEALKEEFTSAQIKWLLLINPTMLLIAAIFAGLLLASKMNLRAPLLESLAGIEGSYKNPFAPVKSGAVGGILAGLLLWVLTWHFSPLLPNEFIELSEELKPTWTARFLYGGLSEEIIMRFGLMTFLAWVFSKSFGEKIDRAYKIAIFLSALVFAMGHLPIAYLSIEHPSSTLIAYILLGNTFAGIIYGALYWKRGLESAMIAHIITHALLLGLESFRAV